MKMNGEIRWLLVKQNVPLRQEQLDDSPVFTFLLIPRGCQ